MSAATDVRRPVRVLHVMNNASGGAALSTIALMTALRERGIASAAVCHDVGNREEREALRDATGGRVRFLILHSWNSKFRTPWFQRPFKSLRAGLRTGWGRWSAREVGREAVRFGADLIHTNTILNPEGGQAARALRLPHVWHLRELIGRDAWFRLPLEGAALGSFLASRCSQVVANSEAAASAIRAALPAELLAVVPNGIDVDRFTSARTGDSHCVVVAMVANLGSYVKKHRLFVEAAARVPRDLPVQFRVYGARPAAIDSGHLTPYLRDLVDQVSAAGLGDRLRFEGFQADPATIMREIDVLVHPSDLESFGRIAVEAMAAWRPVVGVHGGGIAEIVLDGVTGLLSPPDDAAGLANHIERLACDAPLRAAMGAAGRRRAEEKYSLNAHVEGMLAVYAASMGKPVGGLAS